MCAVAPKGGRELLSGGYDEKLLESFRNSFSTGTLVNNIGTLQAALGEMRSGQAKTVCELALITLCEPGLNDTLPMLRERVAALERQIRNGAAAAAPAYVSPVPAPAVSEPVYDAPPLPTDDDAPPFDLPAKPDFPAPAPTPAPAPAPKREAPKPAPIPQPAAAPAAAAPTPAAPVGDDFWDRVRDRLGSSFPVGIAAILTDPMQVSGSLSGDTLYLNIQPGFASNMVDRPDVAAKIAAIASEVAGRQLRVKNGVPPVAAGEAAEERRGSKLDELAKHEIVKFK